MRIAIAVTDCRLQYAKLNWDMPQLFFCIRSAYFYHFLHTCYQTITKLPSHFNAIIIKYIKPYKITASSKICKTSWKYANQTQIFRFNSSYTSQASVMLLFKKLNDRNVSFFHLKSHVDIAVYVWITLCQWPHPLTLTYQTYSHLSILIIYGHSTCDLLLIMYLSNVSYTLSN